jgi:hypothetical protein
MRRRRGPLVPLGHISAKARLRGERGVLRFYMLIMGKLGVVESLLTSEA